MHIVYPAVISALLFSVGVYGVLARRNTILVLMSVELMLNAVNLNLVAFDVWLRDRLHSGQVLTLFVIVIAAAEVGVGLAIVLALYRNRRTVDLDQLRELAEPAQPLPAATEATGQWAPGDRSPDPGKLTPAPPNVTESGDRPPTPGSRNVAMGEAAPSGNGREDQRSAKRGGKP
ncbi:hypothetical protein GCM10012289_33570 [Nonomuraea cavernae]|uniref:NADH-quinone oxidoreductase subunit K n=1 Tax=Nonomuraea cavernae TaxID=2045107 RepID=A0A918DLA1_9ACTN|nr:hypothetical protein GCM10012289_33570 [Nonomuraea cavernae]